MRSIVFGFGLVEPQSRPSAVFHFRSFLVIGKRRSGVNTSTRNYHISKAWSQIMTKHTSCRSDHPWPRARATGPKDSRWTQRLPPWVAETLSLWWAPAPPRRASIFSKSELRPPTHNQTWPFNMTSFGCDGWILFCCERAGSLSKGQICLLMKSGCDPSAWFH